MQGGVPLSQGPRPEWSLSRQGKSDDGLYSVFPGLMSLGGVQITATRFSKFGFVWFFGYWVSEVNRYVM